MTEVAEVGRIDVVVRPTVRTVTTRDELESLVQHYLEQDSFVIDIETSGEHRLDPRRNDVVWIGLATKGRTDVIPMGHPNGELVELRRAVLGSGLKRLSEGKALRKSDVSKSDGTATKVFSDPPEQLTPAEVLRALEPLLFSETITAVAHNLPFDIGSLAKYYGGRIPPPPYGDTRIADFLIDSQNQHKLSLAHCVKRNLGYDMDKGIGKKIEEHTFDEVAYYLNLDARMTWLLWKRQSRLLIENKLERLFKLEMDLLHVLVDMQNTGVLVDVGSLKVLHGELERAKTQHTADAYRAAGRTFNVNSNKDKQDLLYGPEGRNLEPSKFTATGAPSTAADALEKHKRDPLAKALLDISEVQKLLSTYITPYLGGDVERTVQGKSKTVRKESLLVKGRVHTSFNQTGAATGRLSCVSGDTVLRTSRGDFRMDEYDPAHGDLVLTHEGRWMPVVRKIYKGVEDMYSVISSKGGKITCTKEHRFLTPTGWASLGSLSVGDEVLHVSEQEFHQRSRERREGAAEVQVGRQADVARPRGGDRDHVSQRAARLEDALVGGGVRGGESAALLAVQDGAEEPYAGQEWFPAPQLPRGRGGRTRVHDAEGGRSLRAGSPNRDGRSPWSEPSRSTKGVGGASHRRGQEEQLLGQSGAGDSRGAQGLASDDRLAEITFVGAMGVWDIEVAGDHSYYAGGFLNHNSSGPNLQNIPSPRTDRGRQIRNLFMADPGHKLVVADYSQIEPRIMASLSKDPVMTQAYADGKDIYAAIAEPLGHERQAGKTLILAMAYGVGPQKIAESLGISQTKARQLLDDFSKEFPVLFKYKNDVIKRATVNQYAVTVLGRRRMLPDLVSRDEGLRARGKRQAFNHLIQGSASEVMKIALVRAHRMLPDGARMLLTVHDEIVTLAPEELVDETSEAIREAMEGFSLPGLTVPMKAEIVVDTHWGNCK